jgi:hypothetical protein
MEGAPYSVPLGAVAFHSYGNFGSAVLDAPNSGKKLVCFVHDECVKKWDCLFIGVEVGATNAHDKIIQVGDVACLGG